MAVLLLFSAAFADGDTEKETPKKSKTDKYEKRQADNPEIAIETDFGTMKLELFRDVAPGHVDSMLARIKEGFYDGLIFHRIIDGFMIQGGDPQGTGMGGAPYRLKAEFSDLPHLDGTLSMARAQDPNSASSQFFICLGRQAFLDGKYTVFGQVMDGMDVLHKIGKVPCGGPRKSKPEKDVFIRKMTVLKDIPAKKSDK
ncbi:MAG: peptidylprolyl isomerase [Candidatus Zixiibacteriota bacterium]|nr:MAG: peptidylprolyl isomerase [candidate division Zixibacteria bacterium]